MSKTLMFAQKTLIVGRMIRSKEGQDDYNSSNKMKYEIEQIARLDNIGLIDCYTLLYI